MTVEFAKASDLPELLDFLHAVFCRNNPSHPRFETLYPDLLQPTDEAMGRHAIVRENGRIASCVGMYWMELMAGGCRVPIAGIGQVSTGAEYLGRGWMSALLRAQLERAKEEGAALAWLSGRHDRYAHFGFEVVGMNFRYSADAHSTKRMDRSYRIEHGPATAETITPELFALRGEAVEGVLETLPQYHARLARFGYELWTATAPGAESVSAWGVVRKTSASEIVEWCGTEAGRLALFAAISEETGGVVREESVAECTLNEALRQNCGWMGPVSHHLALLNRERLLEAYRPRLTDAVTALPETMDPKLFLRAVFGPEWSPVPQLPFYLPEFAHV